MAKILINSMDTPFEPDKYKDEYQEKLRTLIETKISRKQVVAAESDDTGKVIDLMEALKASVEKAQKDKSENANKKRTINKKGKENKKNNTDFKTKLS